MWKRTASLSPLIFSSKSSSLYQLTHGTKIWKSDICNPVQYSTSLEKKSPFITFVLGGPGSGKGTQCLKIAETFGLTHLSAGDLLRRELLSDSEYGAMILKTIKEGRIVPSEVTVKLIKKELESSDSNKFLIDGFPRSDENRIAFEKIVGVEPNMVLFFDCPEEEMVKRVLNRNEGRVDDNIDTFKNRLEVFSEVSLPVIGYYSKKGKLRKINDVGSVDDIFEQVRSVFTECEVPFDIFQPGVKYFQDMVGKRRIEKKSG